MTDIDLKTASPDATLDANAYLFGADSQSSANPSLYQVSTLRTLLLGGSSDTQVMFNNNGSFGGLSQLTYANSMINVVSAPFGLSGNISAAAWTTNGIRYKNTAATLTDTSSAGTVLAAYTDVWGGNTIAASNSTTFTDYITGWFSAPTAGTNVTITNRWALGVGGNLKLGADASGTNQAGTSVTIGGSRGTGTGAGGSIIFQVAPAGTTGTAQNALATALTIATTAITAQNHLLFSADNNYDIGASGATRPRTGYFGTQLYVGRNTGGAGGTGSIHLLTGGSNASAYLAGAGDGILQLGNWNANDFSRLQFGGATSSFPALKRSSAKIQVVDAAGNFTGTSGLVTQNLNFQGVTIANLPATPAAGDVAYVTDGDASLAWGATAVNSGSGATKYLVWYNGTNWTVAGK